MKIALFTDGIFPFVLGGMQKHSYYLAKYLAQNKVEILVYHFVPSGNNTKTLNKYFSDEELKQIKFIEVDFPTAKFKGSYVWNSNQYSKNIYEVFKKERNVDFVYAQGFTGWKLAKTNNHPPIGTNLHGLEMFQKAANFKENLEKLWLKIPALKVLKNSDYAFSLGGKLTNILENIYQDKTKILETPIGISENFINPDKSENNTKRRFLFIGRYERRKGIEELNKVLLKIEKEHDFEFHFVGPIPEEKQIESSKIIYHGLVKEEQKIINLMQKTDVLVCPSFSEGMPTVILEAMANACATIASNVGAVSCLVDSKTGWLIEAGHLDDLEKSLVDSIKINSEGLKEKKKNAQTLIKNKYTWNKIAKLNLEIIKKISNNN